MYFVAAILVLCLAGQAHMWWLERAIAAARGAAAAPPGGGVAGEGVGVGVDVGAAGENVGRPAGAGSDGVSSKGGCGEDDDEPPAGRGSISSSLVRASLSASFLHAEAQAASHHLLDGGGNGHGGLGGLGGLGSLGGGESSTRARNASHSSPAAALAAGPDAAGHSETLDAELAGASGGNGNGDGNGDGDGDGDGDGSSGGPHGGHGLRAVFTDPLFLTIGAALTAANAVIGMLEPLFQIYMTEKFDLTANYRGLIWSASTLGYLLGTPLAGALAARHKDAKSSLIAAGLACMGLSLPLFAAAPRSWASGDALALATTSLVLVGFGMALVDVPCQPLLADVADYRGLPGYGVAFSLADVAASVGFVVGPLLGGAIADRRGTSSASSSSSAAAFSSVSGMEGACLVFAVVALLVAPAVAVVLARVERGTGETGRGGGGGGDDGDDGNDGGGARKKEQKQKLNIKQQQFA